MEVPTPHGPARLTVHPAAAARAALPARLLRCRATNQTFLDFSERQFTLPVVSEVAADLPPSPVDPFADPNGDPEARPTPGMSVSLGMALPA